MMKALFTTVFVLSFAALNAAAGSPGHMKNPKCGTQAEIEAKLQEGGFSLKVTGVYADPRVQPPAQFQLWQTEQGEGRIVEGRLHRKETCIRSPFKDLEIH